MATIDQRLEAATEKAEQASQILHDVSNGDANTIVTTESGQVDSLAKWQKDANKLVTDDINAKYVIEEAKRNNSYSSAEFVRDTEYSEAEKARDDYFKQEVGSLEQAVTDASNSAYAAAQSASEASKISGLDDVAGAVGVLSPRLDTPDFECPFNDGIELKSGYGTRNAHGSRAIDYSCASAKTSINKSGQIVTLAENEPAIESSGIALFQSLTNKNPNSNKLTHDSKYSETEVSGLFRYEILSDDTTYNLLKFSTYCTSDIGVTFKIKIKDLTGINSIRFRYGNNYIDVNSNLDKEVDIYIPYTSGDKTNCSAYINGYEASPVGTGFTLEYAQVIDGVNITNAPYIPTSGTAVTRAADVAKVTSVNNLPAPGKPFYIVGDVDFGNLVTGQYRAILELDNSTQLKIEVSNTGLFRFRLSNKTLQSDDVISSKARIICYFNGSEYGYYLNTVKGKSSALDNVNYEFTNINLSKTPALNGHLKNWTIKQGVMTDDLAKSYGVHPDA